jgi:GTPase SAR1 family protein
MYNLHMKTIAIVGPAGCGKTCLISAMSGDDFEKKYYPTIGVQKSVVTTTKKFQVYDFPGHEPLDTLKIDDWMKCDFVVICYDQLTDIELKPKFTDHYLQGCENTGKHTCSPNSNVMEITTMKRTHTHPNPKIVC